MRDRLRVLVLHSRYLSGAASGENRVVEDETRLLKEAGHSVRVWDPAPRDTHGLGLVRMGMASIWSPRAVARVSRLVETHRPDVVHFHNLFPMVSPGPLRAVASAGPAVVVTLHNYRLMCLGGTLFRDGRICQDCVGRGPWPGVVHRCYRGSTPGSAALGISLGLHRAMSTFDSVDLFLAISEFVKDKHVEAGLHPDRIVVKPHFAWPVERRRGPGDYFLYVGRLSSEKGLDTVISAWRPRLGPLLVVGDGPEGERMKAQAPREVRFLGSIPPPEVPPLVRRARAIVVPSLCHEGAGKVVFEACAAGVPALASSLGGLPEVVEDGRSGFLLPPGDGEEWARAAKRLVVDAESERLGERAWQLWNERFNPRRGLEDLIAAYRTAIDRTWRAQVRA